MYSFLIKLNRFQEKKIIISLKSPNKISKQIPQWPYLFGMRFQMANSLHIIFNVVLVEVRVKKSF